MNEHGMNRLFMGGTQISTPWFVLRDWWVSCSKTGSLFTVYSVFGTNYPSLTFTTFSGIQTEPHSYSESKLRLTHVLATQPVRP